MGKMLWQDMKPGDSWWTGPFVPEKSKAAWMVIAVVENRTWISDSSDESQEAKFFDITFIQLFGPGLKGIKKFTTKGTDKVPGYPMSIDDKHLQNSRSGA